MLLMFANITVRSLGIVTVLTIQECIYIINIIISNLYSSFLYT